MRRESKRHEWLCVPLCLGVVLWPACAAGGPVRVGIGSADITPPPGTPSAGYGQRLGAGMIGTHDALQAEAMILSTPAKTIVLVGVDNLGFDRSMCQEIASSARRIPVLSNAEVYVGSSHTHAGGGAFMPQPGLAILFGAYQPERRKQYIDGTVKAIAAAAESLRPGKVGIGYGQAEGLNRYRGDWPPKIDTNPAVTVLKAVSLEDEPVGVLFAFAAHPTVLSGSNMQFSADFVGYARKHVRQRLGESIGAVFFNGAQGDVSARPPIDTGDGFARSDSVGRALADVVADVFERTTTARILKIESRRAEFTRTAQPSPGGFRAMRGEHTTEMNVVVLNDRHAFLTAPGELSCILDADIRRFAGWLGYHHCTVLGLTNDAVGYIVSRESWRHRTYESTVSFFGPGLGPFVLEKAYELLHQLEPSGAYHGSRIHAHQPVE